MDTLICSQLAKFASEFPSLQQNLISWDYVWVGGPLNSPSLGLQQNLMNWDYVWVGLGPWWQLVRSGASVFCHQKVGRSLPTTCNECYIPFDTSYIIVTGRFVPSPKSRARWFFENISDSKPCSCVIERNTLVYIVCPGVRPYTPHGITLWGEKSLMTVKKLYGKKTQFSILCYAN